MEFKIFRPQRFFLAAAILFTFLPLTAYPQLTQNTRQIRVIVVDESGAALPNVAVQFKHKGEVVGTVTTDDKGWAVASNFPPGSYEISAAKEGFEAKAYRDILLTDAMSPEVKFELKVRGLADKVEINASTSPTALPEQAASVPAAQLTAGTCPTR
jgi:uncharacterized membrane protein